MSLINEALKRAQRQRNVEATDAAPLPGESVARREQSRGGNSILLIGSGALALVVLSVALTVYLLSRPHASTSPAAPSQPTTKSETVAATSVAPVNLTAPSAAKPTTILPMPETKIPATVEVPKAIANATKAAAPSVAPTLASKTPSPASSPVALISPTAPPPAAAPAPVPADIAAIPASATTVTPAMDATKPDDGIYQYVDALRITGVKAAGNDSRVLMNDRVYRVNDIVERNLGLRLIKVETNTLTFTDTQGAVYVKSF